MMGAITGDLDNEAVNNAQHAEAGEEAHGPHLHEMVFEPSFRFYKNAQDNEPAVSSLWLVTFTDIMALMLTFFVLLYSMSQPEVEKWSEMTAAINNNFSKTYAPPQYAGTVDAISIEQVDNARALDLRYLASIIRPALERNENTKGVLMFMQPDALVISMPHGLFFEAGKAQVGAGGQRILFELGGALAKIRNAIEVVGHADPRPVENSASFKSNWELSLARASAVAGVLENVGYTRSVTLRGMSSARYEDLPEDIPQDERLDLSRRVDIVILKDDGGSRSFLGMKL